MKKTTLKKTLNEMSRLGRVMPRSINESMDFNGLEDEPMDDMGEEMPEEEPVEEPVEAPAPAKEEPTGAEALLNDIRKKALRAMADLADTPEDPNYETLKKIFTMLDKAVVDKQEQREVIAKNPNIAK